ncbi:uncharacterized protein CDAR_466891 [Caerostris darwini]|uniref:Zinc finger CCHC domain-containing protein 7 n=1 Tax=Caerostris darwini TaxID=1538125 RepID=A0AAV4SA66_9ARAC|nr:uncharacterized protein CDAR_466891 [Caerostris darwini]
MDEIWTSIEDTDCSSDDGAAYSDRIDSDVEAELYSSIHHFSQDSTILEKDLTLPKSNSDLLQDNFTPLTNSILLQENFPNEKSNQKNRSSIKVNKVQNEFTSDNIDTNQLMREKLYTSFEAPVKKRQIQNNTQSNKVKLLIPEKPEKRKSDLLSEVLEDIQVNSKLLRQSNGLKRNASFFNLVAKGNRNSFGKIQVVASNSDSDSDSDNSVLYVEPDLSQLQMNVEKETILLNSGSDSESSTQSEKMFNKACKRKSFSLSSAELTENNDEIQVITSDSDSSVVYIEPDLLNQQMNIEKEMIVLSSDSDSNSAAQSEKTFSEVHQNKSILHSSAELIANNDDAWHINTDDLFPSKFLRGNRYHEQTTATCSNCKMKGHKARFCTVPKFIKCFICGGDHAGNKCKNRICFRCFYWGHDSRRCYQRIYSCNLCNRRGHTIQNCPDLWRRFHLTTSMGKIVAQTTCTSNKQIFCYNCGVPGHYGAECFQPQQNPPGFPTWTQVISYNNPNAIGGHLNKNMKKPNDTFRRQLIVGKKTPNDKKKKSNKKKNVPQVDGVRSHSTPLQKKKKKKKKSPPSKEGIKPDKDVYFPRTPKQNPTRRQLQRWQYNENKYRYKQRERQKEWQHRHEGNFASNVTF